MLLDTSIFIDYLKGRSEASAAVLGARSRGVVLMHSTVAAELINGARDKRDLRRATSLISTCETMTSSDSDQRRALHVFEKHILADGPDWNDCQIAATAMRLAVPVVTLNEKHFRVIRGLRVIRPY